MKEIVIIGHKSPDTDSVVSALVASRYLVEDSIPGVLGKINNETKFVLSYFRENEPIEVKNLVEKKVFLVDQNEIPQNINGITEDNIIGVLDHHRLSGTKTERPIFFRIEPIGSTCTLVYKVMKETAKEINKTDAGLLLCGVVSDTLCLTSSTTTEEDRNILKELSIISGIDPINISEKMFEAKSDFSGRSLKEIIVGDMKEFDFFGRKVAIGVCETTSSTYFSGKEEEILQVLKEIKKEKEYDAYFFGVVNIYKKETHLYFPEEDEKRIAESAFPLMEKSGFLPGVTSRKKELVPPLSKYYEEKNSK